MRIKGGAASAPLISLDHFICESSAGIMHQVVRYASEPWSRPNLFHGAQTKMMRLILPTTGEKAFVQVKSKTDQNEFNAEYLEVFREMSQFGRMFYVLHTCGENELTCEECNVTIIDATRPANMVLDAGLVSWLIRKVS